MDPAVGLAVMAYPTHVQQVRENATNRRLTPRHAANSRDILGVQRPGDRHLAHPGDVIAEDALSGWDLLRDVFEALLQVRAYPAERERPRTTGEFAPVARPTPEALLDCL